MPRIPVVETPGVLPTRAPVPQADPDLRRKASGGIEAGLAALGQGLQTVGRAANEAEHQAAQKKAEDQAAQVEKELAAAGDYANKATLAYRAQKGENAETTYAVARKDIDDQFAATMERLTDEKAKQVFAKRALALRYHAYQSMDQHRFEQNDVVKDQAAQAMEASTLDFLKVHASDPDVFSPKGAVQSTVDTYIGTHLAKEMTRKGVSTEPTDAPDPTDPTKTIKQSARDVAVQAWKRKAYGTVMQALVKPPDGREPNAARARDFFEAHKTDLGPDLAEQYAPLVRGLGTRADAESTVQALMTKHGKTVVLPDGSTAKQLDAGALVDGIEQASLSPDAKEHARRLGASTAATYGKLWEKNVDKVYDQAFTAYLRSPTKGSAGLAAVDPKVRYWLEKRSPADWQKLRALAQADDARAARARKTGGGPRGAKPETTVEDKRALIEFVMDVKGNPDKYGSQDYDSGAFAREWGHRLAGKDLDKAIEKLGDAKGQTTAAAGRELRPDVDRYLLEQGGPHSQSKLWRKTDPKKWTDEEASAYYELRGRLEAAVADQVRSGNRPDDKWFKTWIDHELRELVKVPGKLFGEAWPSEMTRAQARNSGRPILEDASKRMAAPAEPPPPVGGPEARDIQLAPLAPVKEEPPPAPGLLPPGVPRAFITAVQAKVGSRTLSASEITQLWERNRHLPRWKGAK